ncbi:MAG: DUF721 domain-containing protein [Candidatus Eremiobacteraeota bacterium]|nr:DUF721 domain-containing protein [Candidatus Eremiobacteraeota bacterium]
MSKLLREIIEKSMQRLRSDNHFQAQWIFLQWSQSAGHEIDRKTQPFKFSGGTLFVHTTDSVWVAHLTGLKKALLEELNRHCAPLAVKDIRFSAVFPFRKIRVQKPAPEEEEPEVTLSQEEEQAIDAIASEVSDEALRARLASIMRKERISLGRKKARGGKPCAGCGVIVERGTLCPFCVLEEASRQPPVPRRPEDS